VTLTQRHVRSLLGVTAVGLAAAAATGVWQVSAQQPAVQRHVEVSARKYAFTPGRIEVNQDDLVKITLRSEDIAHSLTIDAYRIAKRVSPSQPVTFEFRADQAGTFSYYCNLQIDDGCRQMHGQLVVKPHR
jgi:cytochrome c oxidase subunit 2